MYVSDRLMFVRVCHVSCPHTVERAVQRNSYCIIWYMWYIYTHIYICIWYIYKHIYATASFGICGIYIRTYIYGWTCYCIIWYIYTHIYIYEETTNSSNSVMYLYEYLLISLYTYVHICLYAYNYTYEETPQLPDTSM